MLIPAPKVSVGQTPLLILLIGVIPLLDVCPVFAGLSGNIENFAAADIDDPDETAADLHHAHQAPQWSLRKALIVLAAVSLGIKPPIAPLGLRIEGMFNSLGYKSAIADGESLRLLSVTANGTWTMMPTVYLIGGVGMYNGKASVAGAESSNDFGFNVGAGFNIPLTGFGTYIEARYHHIPMDGGSFAMIPISVGIRF